MFTDTHAHLSSANFAKDLSEVIQRAVSAGVSRIVTIATDLEDVRQAQKITERFPNVWMSVGIHPTSLPDSKFSDMKAVAELARHPKVVAIGETGLDYYHSTEHIPAQKDLFRAHLELARHRNLPVVIHNRSSEADLLEILRAEPVRPCPWGVMHCFSGDEKFALACIELGLFISYTGVLTFKNASVLREVAARVPLEHVMLETDCPYLAPMPYRGKRNEPSYVPLIAQTLAEVKGVSVVEVGRVTTENARRLFGLR